MKPVGALSLVVAGFLFGVSFYHYILLRGIFPSSCHFPVIITDISGKAVINGESLLLPTSVAGGGSSGCGVKLPENSVQFEEILKGPLNQWDSRLLNHIRRNGYLLPPPEPSKPYNLTHPSIEDTSMGQAKMILKALNFARNGFFVEAGALDGELRSNTLMLERRYGWTGLLVEGDPKNFALLKEKNRKAWISPACLSDKPYPHEVNFEQAFNRGRIREDAQGEKKDPLLGVVRVQCFPLFSLLAALNLTTVDYVSLDVEGSELAVLETFPFHKIRVKVFSVEFLHSPGGRETLRRMMTSKGYTVYGEIRDPRHNWANDLIFIHNSLAP